MRYWAYFAAKLAAGGAAMAGLWFGVMLRIPMSADAAYYVPAFRHPRFIHDLPWAFALIFYGLVATGLAWLIVWDQRRRCRTCLRKLMMPVETGSWSRVLVIAPPRMEYICPFGHGTLGVPEVDVSTSQPTAWQAHGDFWEELTSGGKRD